MTPEARKTEQALHRQEADKRMYDAYVTAEEKFMNGTRRRELSGDDLSFFAQGFWMGWLMNLGVPIEEIGEEKL
jgi:hypothetical protein